MIECTQMETALAEKERAIFLMKRYQKELAEERKAYKDLLAKHEKICTAYSVALTEKLKAREDVAVSALL